MQWQGVDDFETVFDPCKLHRKRNVSFKHSISIIINAAAINRIVLHFDCYRKCKQNNQQNEQFFCILVKDISQSRGNWIRVRINTGCPRGSV